MGSIRLLAAAFLLIAAAGALGWAWLHADEPTTASGTYPVSVVGADGRPIFNGTLHVENATALSALQAAALAGNFEVRTHAFGAYGSRDCDGTYVESIAGEGASGAAGWVYRIRRAGDPEWTSPVQSAACEALMPGDALEWRWTDSSAV